MATAYVATAGESERSAEPSADEVSGQSTVISPDTPLIGPALAKVREARGLSQRQLAQQSGVAQATISRIEQGHDCWLDTLFLLLDVIGVRPAEFMLDAGLTSQQGELKEYQVTILISAKNLKSVTGNISGPGLKRREK
jgi:transcriptional regulator with XRE-family HTH domain